MGLKRFSLYVFSSVLSLLFTQHGFASDSKLYLGAALGSSSYSSVEDLFLELGDGGTSDITDTAVAYQVQMGWEINQYVGIEIAYTDFGEAESDYRYSAVVNGHDALAQSHYEANLVSTSVSVKGMLPLGDEFRVFAKVGYSGWDAEVTWDEALYFDGNLDSRSKGSVEVDGDDLFYSLGAEYRLTNSIVLSGEYLTQLAEYDDLSGNSYDWFEASAITIGIRWQFDTQVFNRNGPDSQYGNRKLTACDDKYKDIAGAICNR